MRKSSESFIAFTLLLIALTALLGSGCDDGIPTTVDDAVNGKFGMLITGPFVLVSDFRVYGSEAVLTYDNTASPLSGFRLIVPAGAFDVATTWKLSYAEIRAHRYTSIFHPVTPLIRLENGGMYATRPMRLRIPIELPDSVLPVAFRYDNVSGILEALPPVSRTPAYLEVLIRESSEIVVSAISYRELRGLGGYDMGFDPFCDGWAFPNYPTINTRGGFSPGMSIGAAWYFERYRGNPPIEAAFDNKRYDFGTSEIWEDDATGIDLCVRVQGLFERANSSWIYGEGFSLQDPIWITSGWDQFWTICYALMLTGRPQSLLLRVKSDPTKPVHVMLVHGWHFDEAFGMGRLLVYDPNNINDKRNEIRIASGFDELGPIETATNSMELSQGILTSYDMIRFMPWSILYDHRTLLREWKNSAATLLTNGAYTSFEVFAIPVDTTIHERVKLRDLAAVARIELPFTAFRIIVESSDPDYDHPVVFTHSSGTGERVIIPWRSIISLDSIGTDTLIGVYMFEFKLNPTPPPLTIASWAGFRWYRLRYIPD